MATFYLAAEMKFTSVPEATNEQFDEFIFGAMDELLELDVVDPDLTTSLTKRVALISAGVQAEDFEDAAPVFLSALRAALHAAGAHTPEWPVFQRHIQAIRPLELVDAQPLRASSTLS